MKWLTIALIAIAAVLSTLLFLKPMSKPSDLGGTVLSTPIQLPALILQNEQGESTTLSASDHRLRLVFYGFVRCPDVCPATLTLVKQAYSQLTPQQKKQIHIQFISVDPTFDRPHVIKDYLARFNKDFTGLTGDPATINKAAKAMFVLNTRSRLVHDKQSHANHQKNQDSGISAAQASIIHGDQVSIVNSKGEFVHVYNNSEIINGLFSRDLPKLIETYNQKQD